MSLDQEVSYYESIKPKLLEHNEGQFVLIKGKELIGAFTKEGEAYEAGVKKFGNQPFLIKQVLPEDRTEILPALTLGLIRARS
jgi:hypothetical protein